MWQKKLRMCAWSLAVLVGVVNAGCLNLHPPPDPIPPELTGDAPRERWNTAAARGISEPLAMIGPLVVAAATNRQLVAIDLEIGEERWRQRLPGALTGGVLIHNSVLLVGTGRPEGRIDAISSAGRRIWRANSGEVTAPIIVVADMVVAMNAQGQLVAFNLANGRLRWRRGLGLSRTGPLALPTGEVLVSTHDSLYRVEASAGRVLLRRAAPGAILGGWQSTRRGAVAGLAEAAVLAIDNSSLATRWSVRTDAPVIGRVAVRGDTLWAASRIGTVYRVIDRGDSADASVIARLAWPLTSGVTVTDADLIVGGADGHIRGLSRDGEERWRVGVYPSVEVTPLATPRGMLAAGGDGHVHYFEFE